MNSPAICLSDVSDTRNRLDQLQAQRDGVPAQAAPSASAAISSFSPANTSAIPTSSPTASPTAPSAAASSSSPATRELAYYVQQHAADQQEIALLRQQLLQSSSVSSSSLASLWSLVGSVSSAMLLCVGVWLWRRQAGGGRRLKAGDRSWWQALNQWLSGLAGWFTG